MGKPGPHPTSESAPYATRTQCRPPAPGPWTPALPWTQRARPPELGKPRGRGFPQRPQPSSSSSSRSTREDRCPSRAHRRVSRICHFLAIVDTTIAGRIANERTRAAYGRSVGQFLAWCEGRGLGLGAIAPLHVAAYIRTHPGAERCRFVAGARPAVEAAGKPTPGVAGPRRRRWRGSPVRLFLGGRPARPPRTSLRTSATHRPLRVPAFVVGSSVRLYVERR